MPEERIFGIRSYGERYRLLLLLTIITLPVSIPLNTWCIGLLFLNSITASRNDLRNIFKRSPLLWLFAALFAFYALSMIWSENIPKGLSKIQTKGPLLIFAIALGIRSLNLKARVKIYQWFIFSVSACALFALFVAFYKYLQYDGWYRYYKNGAIRDHHLFYTGLAEPVMHPGYFSVYIGVAIFLILKLNSLKRNIYLISILIPCLIAFMFMLQGRINILAFGLIFALYIIYQLIKHKRFIILGTGSALLVIAAFLFVRFLPDTVTSRLTQGFDMSYDLHDRSMDRFSGFTIRLAEWECAWPVIEENWLTGVGIGDADAALLESYKEKGFYLGIERKFNAHNQYLQTWLSAGLPALFCLLAILFAVTRAALKRQDIFLLMTIWFFYLSMLTESMLERHWAGSLFASLIFMMSLCPDDHRNAVKTTNGS